MGDADVNSRMTVRLLGMDGAASVGVVSYAGGVSWNGQTFASMRAVKNPTGAYFDVYGSGAATCRGRRLRRAALRSCRSRRRPARSATRTRSTRSACAEPERVGRPVPRADRRVGPRRHPGRQQPAHRGLPPRRRARARSPPAGPTPAGVPAPTPCSAQAVAARSYALAQNRYSYAKTCDTTACQAYDGTARRRDDRRATRRCSRTIAATRPSPPPRARSACGGNGTIVSTEFSASNGPRTAGGSFPVRDDAGGDGTAPNPNHRWVRVLDADALAATYGLGSITSAQMVEAADPRTGSTTASGSTTSCSPGRTGTRSANRRGTSAAPTGSRRPASPCGSSPGTRRTRRWRSSATRSASGWPAPTPPRCGSLTDGTFASSAFDSAVSRRTNVASDRVERRAGGGGRSR